jgi:hypothetical protein
MTGSSSHKCQRASDARLQHCCRRTDVDRAGRQAGRRCGNSLEAAAPAAADGDVGWSRDDAERPLLLARLPRWGGPAPCHKVEGMPPDEDIAKLRAMLLHGTAPGAAAASERLKQLEDWEGVSRSWEAALTKVVTDPEGAITATRTTLESVCKHICDERGVLYDDGWEIYLASTRPRPPLWASPQTNTVSKLSNRFSRA